MSENFISEMLKSKFLAPSKESLLEKIMGHDEAISRYEKRMDENQKHILHICRDYIKSAKECMRGYPSHPHLIWNLLHRVDEHLIFLMPHDELYARAIDVRTAFDLTITDKKVREDVLGERGTLTVAIKDIKENSQNIERAQYIISGLVGRRGERSMKTCLLSAFIAMAIVLSGCATTISGTVKPPAASQPTGTFLVGASKADITPPPGYPMGGHSIAGQISRGYWLRLFARSIFLEDHAGTRMVLVSADLWSVPAGLADRVAELNSQGPAECTVGRAGLILAATHTHQSPANFSSSPMYNAFASPVSGFDPDLFEFLARRIAFSIENACKNRQQAQVSYITGRMTQKAFARNRSYEAFLMDPEAKGILQENADLPLGEQVKDYRFPESYRAIDPTLRVLRVREAAPPHRDIAIAAFVAVHATSLTHAAEVYNSDLFGVAAVSAERRLSAGTAGTPSVVVAIFNGAEGDISPAWIKQDRRDTLRLGEDLAENITSRDHGMAVEGELRYQFSLESLAGKCLPEIYGKTLCTDTEPMAGAATMGGAEDGRTILHSLGWREGVKGHSNAAQAPKQPALDLPLPFESPISLTRLIGKISAAPKVVPIGVYSFGPLIMATLPGEFTMVLGRRITAEVKDSLKGRPEDMILIGLANEYLSYFTTPEEYEEQSYEGASMLYGRFAGAYVGHRLGLLAGNLQRGEASSQVDFHYRYETGPVRQFGIEDIQAVNLFFLETGLSPILQDTDTGRSILGTAPTFCWGDRIVDLRGGADIEAEVTPRVSLLTKTKDASAWEPLILGGHREDDSGLNFLTVALAPREDQVSWCVFWLPPKDFMVPAMSIRFSVHTVSGKTVLSPECMILNGEVNEECRFDTGWIPNPVE